MLHYEVLGVRTPTYEFWRDTIQPIIIMYDINRKTMYTDVGAGR